MNKQKPLCRIKQKGPEGNVFFILGKAKLALAELGLHKEAKEMTTKTMQAKSYREALSIMGTYVDLQLV
jgi:hypothetical protein